VVAIGEVPMARTFEHEVICHGGGAAHKHTLVIEPNESGVYGASPPTKVRLQFICPVSGQAVVVPISPPVGASRPFDVKQVK
jgi:hypothetical protein